MKRYLIALIFPAVLIGCASSSGEDQTTLPATSDNTTLTSYSWQLKDARNAKGMLITPLFVLVDKPVQVDFNNGRFNVSNTCNSMGGQYSLYENRMTFGTIAATRKMCANSKLAALDHEVGNRLSGVSTYTITPAEQPLLTLTTAGGDTLQFAGTPTPATRYGTEGEIVFFEVASKTMPCSHPLIPNKQCLQVRQVYYDSNGLKTGTPGPWQAFYQDIEGYTFQPGVRNVLRVKRYKIANPPADASDTAYILDMVVESQIIKTTKKPQKRR
ncbi:META and DUF4377 domain-containing protein [Oxalobacter sp. OttesenSCG-928-P03]|nr:META and DUF4377 domain-containing protein [Oxalobacter sp. OttesenSCG-928-P03]